MLESFADDSFIANIATYTRTFDFMFNKPFAHGANSARAKYYGLWSCPYSVIFTHSARQPRLATLSQPPPRRLRLRTIPFSLTPYIPIPIRHGCRGGLRFPSTDPPSDMGSNLLFHRVLILPPLLRSPLALPQLEVGNLSRSVPVFSEAHNWAQAAAGKHQVGIRTSSQNYWSPIPLRDRSLERWARDFSNPFCSSI